MLENGKLDARSDERRRSARFLGVKGAELKVRTFLSGKAWWYKFYWVDEGSGKIRRDNGFGRRVRSQ